MIGTDKGTTNHYPSNRVVWMYPYHTLYHTLATSKLSDHSYK